MIKHSVNHDNGDVVSISVETFTCKIEIKESGIRIWRNAIAFDHFLFGIRPGDNFVEISLPMLPSGITKVK